MPWWTFLFWLNQLTLNLVPIYNTSCLNLSNSKLLSGSILIDSIKSPLLSLSPYYIFERIPLSKIIGLPWKLDKSRFGDDKMFSVCKKYCSYFQSAIGWKVTEVITICITVHVNSLNMLLNVQYFGYLLWNSSFINTSLFMSIYVQLSLYYHVQK